MPLGCKMSNHLNIDYEFSVVIRKLMLHSADPICSSQTAPMWLAAGVLLYLLIQSAPLSWRNWLFFYCSFTGRPFLIHFLYPRNCCHYPIVSASHFLFYQSLFKVPGWMSQCLSNKSPMWTVLLARHTNIAPHLLSSVLFSLI